MTANPFDDLIAGVGRGDPFDLDGFLRMLGATGEERSPGDHLNYAFEALTAARKLGDPAAYTRALENFRRAIKARQGVVIVEPPNTSKEGEREARSASRSDRPRSDPIRSDRVRSGLMTVIKPERIYAGGSYLVEVRVVGPKPRLAGGFVAIEFPGTPYGEIRVLRDQIWKGSP